MTSGILEEICVSFHDKVYIMRFPVTKTKLLLKANGQLEDVLGSRP